MVLSPSLRLLFCAVAIALWAVPAARAQQQEKGFLDRLDHPDRTLHYSPSDKQFSTSSTVSGKQAAVKTFGFSRSAILRTDDGAFRTHAFHDKDKFRTGAYATRTSPTAERGFSQTDKTFGTKTMAVKEDRSAHQTVAVSGYTPFDRPFLGRGRRQDSIDDIRNQKNLTIDEVRELLNKNK